jgi:hypothetical protein
MKLIESRKRTTTCRLSSGRLFGFFASLSLSLSLSLTHTHTHVEVYIYIYIYIYSRHMKGEDITSLNHKELMLLEEALGNGLSSIRERQVRTKIVIIYLIEGLRRAFKRRFNSLPFLLLQMDYLRIAKKKVRTCRSNLVPRFILFYIPYER